MPRLRSIHLIVGTLGLIAFLLSGQYMQHALAHLQGMPDGPRLMYRSAHIYLLWTSLLNLLLGSYFFQAGGVAARRWQAFASLLILLSPLFIGISFFVESRNSDLLRPYAAYSIYLAAGACVVHALVARAERRRRRGDVL